MARARHQRALQQTNSLEGATCCTTWCLGQRVSTPMQIGYSSSDRSEHAVEQVLTGSLAQLTTECPSQCQQTQHACSLKKHGTQHGVLHGKHMQIFVNVLKHTTTAHMCFYHHSTVLNISALRPTLSRGTAQWQAFQQHNQQHGSMEQKHNRNRFLFFVSSRAHKL